MSIQKTDVFLHNRNIVLRNIHDAFFLIDISDNYNNDKCALYEINQSGKFLWEKIDSVNTENELVQLLLCVITDKVAEEIVQNDVCDFLQTMLTMGFIEVKKIG